MSKDTKYESINSTLSAIGKAVFVNYYYDFKNPMISEEKIAEKLLSSNPGTKSHKQGFRVPRARHLFKEKQNLDALRIIYRSERLSEDVRKKALTILREEYKLLCDNNSVEADSLYRGNDGCIYRIISIGLDKKDLQPVVVYQDVTDKSKIWIGPLAEWIDELDCIGNKSYELLRIE